MNLHYQYYWFKEVIPHDICDKIIQMGNKRIEQIKKMVMMHLEQQEVMVKKQKTRERLVQKN